jgi:hypothetical protein
MPENAALLAVLMVERPMCVACLSEKAHLTPAEVEAYIPRMAKHLDVRQGVDRCRSCADTTDVFSLRRLD